MGEDVTATYAELGLTRKVAWRGRQYAAIPRDVLDRHLATKGGEGALGLAARYTGAAIDQRVKIRTDDPARAAWTIAKSCSAGFVEELVAFLADYLRQSRMERGA